MDMMNPFDWHGPVTKENIAAVADTLRLRLQAAQPYTICCHNTLLGPTHSEESFGVTLRGGDPVYLSVGEAGTFHVFDTSSKRVWGARTDSQVTIAFLERGVVLHSLKEASCSVTYVVLTELRPPEQGTVNTLDLSTFSMPVLCRLPQALYETECEATAPTDLTARAWWIRDHWTQLQGNMNRVVDEIALRQKGQRATEGRRLLVCGIFTTLALSGMRQLLMQELAKQYGSAPDPTDKTQCQAWIAALEHLYQLPLYTELVQRGFYLAENREKEA
jgi:hypothetical protein